MGYTIDRADVDGDRERILEVWRRTQRDSLEAKYEWIYRGNPAGPAAVWLLRDTASGQDVGMAALFPKRFSLRGRKVRGAIAGDLVVDPEHRSAGPALQLQRAVVQGAWAENVDFLYGFPNEMAEPVLKRVGYKLLGRRARYVKVIRSESFLAARPASKLLARRAGPAADLLASTNERLIVARNRGRYRAGAAEGFDERFDALLSEVAEDYPVMGLRDASYLRWRYAAPGGPEHGIFTLSDRKSGALRGYVVHRRHDGAIEIRDVLAAARATVWAQLVASFSLWARKERAVSVTLAGLRGATLERSLGLGLLGFLRREDPHHVLAVPSPALSNEATFADPDSWFLLQSDDDCP